MLNSINFVYGYHSTVRLQKRAVGINRTYLFIPVESTIIFSQGHKRQWHINMEDPISQYCQNFHCFITAGFSRFGHSVKQKQR